LDISVLLHAPLRSTTMGYHFVFFSAFPIAVREELQSIDFTDPIMRSVENPR
jgi:hypothetical protein